MHGSTSTPDKDQPIKDIENMTPNKTDYKEHDKVAKSMGLEGAGGRYVTPLGVEIDTTATKPDRLAFGYVIARKLGHITKW